MEPAYASVISHDTHQIGAFIKAGRLVIVDLLDARKVFFEA